MYKIYFLLFFSFVLGKSLAQTKFYATVSAKEIGKEDFLQLKLIVENANSINKISNPMLANFNIESGPNEETGITIVNGKSKKYVALNYILKPKSIGTFTIPTIIAIVDGKEYRTENIIVKVLAKPTVGNQNIGNNFDGLAIDEPQTFLKDYIIKHDEDPAAKLKGNMFVKAIVSAGNCFVGQPIEVTYKLYTRLKSESNVIKNPTFNGFSVVDMEQGSALDYKVENFKGKEYNVYTIRKVQLFPLQAGSLSIDEIEVENLITFIKEEYIKNREQNFFDDFGQIQLAKEALQNFKINLKSDIQNIIVKPLPEKNVPNNFKGAVGNFKINAQLEKDTIAINETGKLIVTIGGEGNLHLINAPEIQWTKGFDVFELVAVENISKNEVPISGEKIFTYPFAVNDSGNFIIDGISFSFFDLKEKQYKKLNVAPIKLYVNKSVSKKLSNNEVSNANDSILSKLNKNRKWVIAILALLVATGIAFWLKKEKRIEQTSFINEKILEETENEKELLSKENWLAQSREILQANKHDEVMFYKTLNYELNQFFVEKFKLDKATINRQRIISALQQKNSSNVMIEKVSKLLDRIDNKLYNPFAEVETIDLVFENAEDIINQLT